MQGSKVLRTDRIPAQPGCAQRRGETAGGQIRRQPTAEDKKGEEGRQNRLQADGKTLAGPFGGAFGGGQHQKAQKQGDGGPEMTGLNHNHAFFAIYLG